MPNNIATFKRFCKARDKWLVLEYVKLQETNLKIRFKPTNTATSAVTLTETTTFSSFKWQAGKGGLLVSKQGLWHEKTIRDDIEWAVLPYLNHLFLITTRDTTIYCIYVDKHWTNRLSSSRRLTKEMGTGFWEPGLRREKRAGSWMGAVFERQCLSLWPALAVLSRFRFAISNVFWCGCCFCLWD